MFQIVPKKFAHSFLSLDHFWLVSEKMTGFTQCAMVIGNILDIFFVPPPKQVDLVFVPELLKSIRSIPLNWKGGENWKMGSDFLFLSSSLVIHWVQNKVTTTQNKQSSFDFRDSWVVLDGTCMQKEGVKWILLKGSKLCLALRTKENLSMARPTAAVNSQLQWHSHTHRSLLTPRLTTMPPHRHSPDTLYQDYGLFVTLQDFPPNFFFHKCLL